MSQRKMYFGPAEVISVIEMSYKTPGGQDVVKVILDRPVQPCEVITKSSFEKLSSLEPVEDTLFQERRYKPVIDNFIQILLEEGIIYTDVNYICKQTHERISTAFERATNYLWTKNDKEFIPGRHELTNRSLIEAEAILREVRNESKPTTEQNTESVA